ncbi:hypothetical protein BH92_25090 [Rhodococcoides fascians A21d2]|uniref:hypothetical protein n=1 Tax=Rhodococcoides fascians TaxID=1828 RepID=UPI00055CAF59|nr:hypothetical protein [Rhodococcus fascians]QII02707.1 hypothetical protein BH92_25090 [Rhodococcus fascians A21d2]
MLDPAAGTVNERVPTPMVPAAGTRVLVPAIRLQLADAACSWPAATVTTLTLKAEITSGMLATAIRRRSEDSEDDALA